MLVTAGHWTLCPFYVFFGSFIGWCLKENGSHIEVTIGASSDISVLGHAMLVGFYGFFWVLSCASKRIVDPLSLAVSLSYISVFFCFCCKY